MTNTQTTNGTPRSRTDLDRLKDPVRLRRRAAARRLARNHFLPEAQHAIPALTAALDDSDPAVVKDVAAALALIDLPTDDLLSRISDFKTLGLIGPPARSAIPRLLANLPDRKAVEALRLIGPGVQAVPALFEACESEDLRVRQHAVRTIAEAGRPAMGEVLARLSDPDGTIRRSARTVLEHVAWVPREGAHRVLDSFGDVSLWRGGLITKLFTPDAREAVLKWIEDKALVMDAAAHHRDPEVRRFLAGALRRTDSRAESETLHAAVDDTDPRVRELALVSAAIANPKRAVPLIADAWRRDAHLRGTLVTYLPPTDPVARAILEEALDDVSSVVRRGAAEALAGSGVAPGRVTTILISELDNRHWRCARKLARLDQARAIKKLVECLQTEADEQERRTIAAELCRLDRDHPALSDFEDVRLLVLCDLRPVDAARLLPGLGSENLWVRQCVADALLEAGVERDAVTACLLDTLESSEMLYDAKDREIYNGASFDSLHARWPWFVRGLRQLETACPIALLEHPQAAVQLNACRILQHDDRVVDVLTPYLGDFFHNGVAAAELLAHLGARAAPALDRVVELLTDPYELFRDYAVRILGHIGPKAADVVPALIASDRDDIVDAVMHMLPEFADLKAPLDVILTLNTDYRNDLRGRTVDEVRLYLQSLRERRNVYSR